uniref:Mitochondrial genome maintenance exonuclease 1 n=1 Tax=Ornithodoros turicata TaxID=34597 RepID=A0A2R5LJQ1_9ACAR
MSVNFSALPARLQAAKRLIPTTVPQRTCQCSKSTKPPKTSVVAARYDGKTRVPVETVNSGDAVKKINFENLSLFGPLLKSTPEQRKDEQMGFRMTYLDEKVPRRLTKPKLACHDPAVKKITVKEYGYRTLPDVEYSDAIQAPQHDILKLNEGKINLGKLEDSTRRESCEVSINIPQYEPDLKATLSFPIFNYARKDGSERDSNSAPSSFPFTSRKYPSVTTILKETMDEISKQRLEKWKQAMIAELGEKGFEKYQELLLTRGRTLHQNICDFLRGQPVGELDITPDNQGHWESLQSLLPQIQNVRFLETFVSHPHLQYQGIVDCVAVYEGELILIDWKTSKKTKSRLSQTYDNPLQVAAYVGALNYDDNYDVQVKSAAIVVAYEDGQPCDVHRMGPTTCETNWHRWLKRIRVYWQSLGTAD